jgi:hypothetical protein
MNGMRKSPVMALTKKTAVRRNDPRISCDERLLMKNPFRRHGARRRSTIDFTSRQEKQKDRPDNGGH